MTGCLCSNLNGFFSSIVSIIVTANEMLLDSLKWILLFGWRGDTLPPKPTFQFLLGSTPTQLEPGLGFLVLRHMRFCREHHHVSWELWVTLFGMTEAKFHDSRWSGCRQSRQGWSWSPGRYPSCPGWRWGRSHVHNHSQSSRGLEMQPSLQQVLKGQKLQGKVKKVKNQEKMEAPSWRTRCRWPGWPTPWSGCRCQSRWQDGCL